MKALIALQKQWGAVHDMYGSQRGSMFAAQPIPRRVRDPDSQAAGYWDLTSIVMLVYVAYMVCDLGHASTALQQAVPPLLHE